MIDIGNAIEKLKGLEMQYGNANILKQPLQIAMSALEKQERYEQELEMIYKMADDMALTGNNPSSKEHAEAMQNYLDWVEAGQMVAEVENEN